MKLSGSLGRDVLSGRRRDEEMGRNLLTHLFSDRRLLSKVLLGREALGTNLLTGKLSDRRANAKPLLGLVESATPEELQAVMRRAGFP